MNAVIIVEAGDLSFLGYGAHLPMSGHDRKTPHAVFPHDPVATLWQPLKFNEIEICTRSSFVSGVLFRHFAICTGESRANYCTGSSEATACCTRS